MEPLTPLSHAHITEQLNEEEDSRHQLSNSTTEMLTKQLDRISSRKSSVAAQQKPAADLRVTTSAYLQASHQAAKSRNSKSALNRNRTAQ
jgi:hypothetical protein